MTDDSEVRIAAMIADAVEFSADVADCPGGKPRIRVDKLNPNETMVALRDVLAKHAKLYDRGVIVEVVEDRLHGGLIAHPVSPESLVRIAHEVGRPYTLKPQRKGLPVEVDAALPSNLAAMFLAWRGGWNLPPLNGLTSSPYLAEDGSIDSAPGYNAASGFLLLDAPDIARFIPDRPTRVDAEHALRRLRNQFSSFCFADATMSAVPDMAESVVDIELPPGHDESAFLAALLTAVCRASLPLAPGVLIRAASMSGAGSGKGLLARCISVIAFGRQPYAVTAGGNSQELEKRIGSELVAGGPTLFLDNLNDRAFKSDLLASAISERPARVRVLGKSLMVTMNATALVMLTGNGLNVSEDLARRFISIELDPRTEDPEARRFTGDILAEVGSRRADLLTAALTIWRWGLRSDEIQKGKPLGSFEVWSRWVRDPLVALGCRDPVERTTEAKQRDVRRQELAEAFGLWLSHHGNKPVTVDKLHDDVKAALDPQQRGRQFLARKVGGLEGTRHAGYVMIRQKGGKWGGATYALIESESSETHRGHRGDEATPMPGSAWFNKPDVG